MRFLLGPADITLWRELVPQEAGVLQPLEELRPLALPRGRKKPPRARHGQAFFYRSLDYGAPCSPDSTRYRKE